MTGETFEKAKKLFKEKEQLKENIRKVGYTQAEQVKIRESYLTCIGIEEGITIPESLFRVIGKLILSECNQRLIELEKEVSEL